MCLLMSISQPQNQILVSSVAIQTTYEIGCDLIGQINIVIESLSLFDKWTCFTNYLTEYLWVTHQPQNYWVILGVIFTLHKPENGSQHSLYVQTDMRERIHCLPVVQLLSTR